MTRNVESIFGAVVTAPHQIPYTYTATGGETFISLPFYPVTGFITINGGVQVPIDNYEIDGNTVNLGRSLEPEDVVYCLFDKILSPEDYENGIRIYKFQAVGNETSFTPDFTTYGVQTLYIDGKFQVPGVDYNYNSATGVVSFLNGSPAAGVWVVAEMSIKQNYLALSSDGGASLIGTTSGKTVQEELNSVDNDLVKLKLNWAIENGYADSGLIFTTGGTLTVNDRNKVVYDPASLTWYSWVGALPKTIPAETNPLLDANWKPQTDPNLRGELAKTDGAHLVGGALYSDIRAYTGSFDEIKCLGRSSKRDGGEGWFFLDSTDTTSTDDDGTVLVDASNRRWKRAFDGSKKAAWFGVKGGVDAASALQAAVNTGGKIEVKDGQHPINARVNIDTTGTTFPSLGRDSKRVSFSGESAHGTTFKPLGNFIRMVCSSNAAFGQGQLNWTTFRDFCVFPDTAGNPVGTALDFVDGISNSIDNVIIRRMDIGVSLVGMLSGSVRNTEIDRNRIGVYLDAGPTLGNINNYNFSGNQISLNAEFAVKGTVGTRVVFENGGFEQNGQGLDGSGGTESTGCIDIAIAEPMGVVTFSNLYFEGNEGLADIIIRNATPTGTPVIVNIMNCKFGRGNSRGKGTKYVLQTFSPGGAPIIVNFFGCQFFMQKSFGYDPGVDGWYINNRPYLYCRGLDSCYYSHPEYIDPSLHTQSYATGISVAADGTALIAPNGVTITKTGTGTYRLVSTYGWGTSVDMYQVVGTTPSSGNTILHVNKVTSTTFDVIVQGTGGGAVDSKFDLVITKPHSRYGT